MRILIVLIILLSACGARKVQKSTSQQLDRVKNDQLMKAESSFSLNVTDQSKATKSFTDHSKMFENEDNMITADAADYDTKTGNVTLKGNVKISQKKTKQTDLDKRNDKAISNNVQSNAKSDEAKSSHLKNENTNKNDQSKVDKESKGTILSSPLIWILVIILVIAGIKFKKLW